MVGWQHHPVEPLVQSCSPTCLASTAAVYSRLKLSSVIATSSRMMLKSLARSNSSLRISSETFWSQRWRLWESEEISGRPHISPFNSRRLWMKYSEETHSLSYWWVWVFCPLPLLPIWTLPSHVATFSSAVIPSGPSSVHSAQASCRELLRECVYVCTVPSNLCWGCSTYWLSWNTSYIIPSPHTSHTM